MPGRLFLTKSAPQIGEYMGGSDPGIVGTVRQNICPGQNIVVCDRDRHLNEMQWGIIPVDRINACGRPVMQTIVSVRSETLF